MRRRRPPSRRPPPVRAARRKRPKQRIPSEVELRVLPGLPRQPVPEGAGHLDPRHRREARYDAGRHPRLHMLRPSRLLGFEDPDRPQSLERIIEACGAEAVDYPSKIKCCGFPIVLARAEVALGELIQPLVEAKEAGADAMVTPCPLCHLSLDAWQGKAS